MLETHPYVRAMHVENDNHGATGKERVLVVEAQLWWPSEYSVTNDNGLLDSFHADLHSLERQMMTGQVDYTRIELRPVD